MSNQEQAARLAELVESALELPVTERADFVHAACGDDAGLRVQVEALLRHQDETDNFLETPSFRLSEEWLREEAGAELDGAERWPPGTRVGEYVVGALLGEGGMGEVYRAEDTRLRRQVALKVVRHGYGTGRWLERFRHEERILAALNHPNIARLYDRAAAPDGTPFLVMELVEGERLDTYCQARALSVETRLTLFRKICAAVTYAHQNLVVHRDLKPANIRVTPEGEPKLLDFGIAKLLEPESGTSPIADPTVTLQRVMTPEYASPEQMRGEPVTTASDVYSLGVVLYELLTGQRPFAHLKGRRPDELARAVCEEEPPRASTVADRTGTTVATSSPTRLRRRLAGDLDNIVARALRKEPARRYPNVLALAEDLRRHGEGLPVSAHRDTFSYRAGKFVRRHKAGVAAAALGALALVGGLVATAWQAHVADQQRDHARRAQADAEAARRQAERVSEFFRKLLASASPNKLGRDVKVVEALDAAGKTIDQELAAEPEILAQVHLTLCRTYKELQLPEPSIRHGRTALESLRRLRGDDDALTMQAAFQLGSVLINSGRYAEAESPLRQVLAWQDRQAAPDRSTHAETLTRLATVLSETGRTQEAAATLAEARPLLLASAGENSLAYAILVNALGLVKERQGDFAGATAAYRQAAELCDRVAPGSGQSIFTRINLCGTLLALDNTSEMEPVILRLIEDARRVYGENSTWYHEAMMLSACRDFALGDYPQVMPVARSFIAAMGANYPDDHPSMVQMRATLGASLVRTGHAAEGEAPLRQAFEHGRKLDKILFAQTVGNLETVLGECLSAQGRYAEAEPLLLTGHDDLEKRLGPQNRLTLYSKGLLHTLYTDIGQPDKAARY